jgi:hypothetical protein
VPVSVSVPGRPPSAVFDHGHAFSAEASSESKLSSEPSASNAARLRRAGGLHSSEAAPPSLYGIAPIPDLWPRFPPSARSVWPDGLSLLAPVGETHPEAQTRRDRETSATLRFRGARFCPSAPEVGVAAAPSTALLLRASAAARDTRPSGTRKRAPADHVSRASRRGPPQQRHADSTLRVENDDRGGANT